MEARRLAVLDDAYGRIVRTEGMPIRWQSRVSWAILLELYRAYMDLERCAVKQVQLASGAPDATVQRYLSELIEGGWVRKTPSDADRRVMYVSLTGTSINILDAWADKRIEQMELISTSRTASA